MKNKKLLILSILSILLLIGVTVGISLAFFNYAQAGTTDNTIETGNITFLYTETSSVGRGIAIEDAFPITDTEGKALTGEGNVFDFNINSSKSGHNKRIDYEITARKSDDSTLDEDVVVMYLTKVNGVNENDILLNKYSNLTDTEKVSGYNEKTLYSTAVYVADDTYSQDYRLRMWITNDGTFDNDDMGKTFTIIVNVYADAKVVEEGQIAFENNTLIDNLSVGGSTITPVENENYEYSTVLPYDTQEANIVIETENPNAKIDIKNVTSEYAYTNIIQKMSTTRKLEGLVNGDNYFDITITSENGKVEDEYILKVEIKDITPPVVSGTLNQKTLTITYSDNVGVVGYVVSTSENAPTNGWENISSTTSGNISYILMEKGSYYIYVKDAEGNITRSLDMYTPDPKLYSYPSVSSSSTYAASSYSCDCHNEEAWYCGSRDASGVCIDWYRGNDIEKCSTCYKCNNGDSISGTTCTHITYTCPDGGTLSSDNTTCNY